MLTLLTNSQTKGKRDNTSMRINDLKLNNHVCAVLLMMIHTVEGSEEICAASPLGALV